MSLLRLANGIIEAHKTTNPRVISLVDQINNYTFDEHTRTATPSEFIAVLRNELDSIDAAAEVKQALLDLLEQLKKYMQADKND